MKTLLFTLCTAALLQSAFAQWIPVQHTIPTPYGKRTVNTYMPTQTPPLYKAEGKYEFTIILKNDSAIVAKTKIDHSKQKHSVTIRDADHKKKIIYPSDTKGLTRIDETGNELYGIPTDSCWLFQSASGRINSFSFLAETGMDFIIAIQEGDDGRIVPLTKRNLLRIVGDDPKLQKLIDKGRLTKVIKLFNKDEEFKTEEE